MSSLTSEFLTAFKILSAGQAGAEAKQSDGEDLVSIKLSEDDDWQDYPVSDGLIKELRKLRRFPGISMPEEFGGIVREKLAKFLPVSPSPGATKPEGKKPDLFECIRDGVLDQLGALVAGGAELKVTDDAGMTPLHAAARAGNADMVALLLSHGAEPDKIQEPHGFDGNDRSWTSLHYACNSGSEEAVKRLLQAGADTGPEDIDSRKPLHLAAKSGSPAMIQQLIDSGAEVSAVDRNQKTALHYAAYFGHAEVFKLLVELGIDVNIEDAYGHTALEESTPALLEDDQILESVKKAGGDPERIPKKSFAELSIEELEKKYEQKVPKRFATFIQDKSYEKYNGFRLSASMVSLVKKKVVEHEQELEQVADLKIYFNEVDEEDELRVHGELYMDWAVNSDGYFGPLWKLTDWKVDPAKKNLMPFAILDSDEKLEAKPFLIIDATDEDLCPVLLVWDGKVFIQLADSMDAFLENLSS